MQSNRVIIWGAGKIGRGLAGDLFQEVGKTLTFVDSNQDLVEELNRVKAYTVYNHSKQGQTQVRVKIEEALLPQDPLLSERLKEANLLFLAVQPANLEESIKALSLHLEKREIEAPLDIWLCLNMDGAKATALTYFEENLSAAAWQYFKAKVGLAETIVIRMAVEPQQAEPLAVLTNGYTPLIVDLEGLKTPPLKSDSIVYSSEFAKEQERKFLTYNMAHAIIAYGGTLIGEKYVFDAISKALIALIVRGALDEVSQALQRTLGYSSEAMEQWNRAVMDNMANPFLNDTLKRVGSNVKRKITREERLLKGALLCRSLGIMPYYLYLGLALAYCNGDPEIEEYIAVYGFKAALQRFSGLDKELDALYLIGEHYKMIQRGELSTLIEREEEITLAKRLYKEGFNNELVSRGCGQCAIKTFTDLYGNPTKETFQAATAFSGGMSLAGDGVCGGYSGALLVMGSFIGRRYDHLDDGDKVRQYKAYEMGQKLREKFLEAFGSVICSEVQRGIFGQPYPLLTKTIRNEFEEAGAHRDKCTSVIALSSVLIGELLREEGLI
ncbi:MAG: C-GCAxxG-C-C family (seleno)protein [Sphaerochaetaceae bacterium]